MFGSIQCAAPFFPSYQAQRQKKSFEAGWITVAIQLACEEPDGAGEWKYGRQAKVLVGYCPDTDWEYRWIFDTADPDGAGKFEDCTPEGKIWVHDDDDGGWFYAVQLDALDSVEAVDECLVTPLRALIKKRWHPGRSSRPHQGQAVHPAPKGLSRGPEDLA
ncbi:hypothetical protein ACFOHS_19935 [Jhaorihella thermophila]